MFALESIRKISAGISEAYHTGHSIRAREDMLIGSMYGGMALTCAGTAAVHALAYPLGGKFHIPHGVANSMLLPHVMRFNMDCIQGRLADAARAMGLPEGRLDSAEAAAQAVVAQIEAWTAEFQIPQNLRTFGVEDRHIPELAAAASKVTRLLNNNPKPMSVAQIEDVYKKLLDS
jgi:alcohol dehydrogenase class IV